MAVEVIGQSKGAYKYRVCKNCGAKLRYVQADVKVQTVRDYSGVSDDYHWIECPQCKKQITVKGY